MNKTTASINIAALVLAVAVIVVLSLTLGGGPSRAGQSDSGAVAPPKAPEPPERPVHSTLVPPGEGPQPVVGEVDYRSLTEPVRVPSKYPPGSSRPVTDLPKVTDGIPLPDGTFLPYLNGMTHAPILSRDQRYGPLPKVVAIQVDVEGYEWYVHADGSSTTSKHQPVVLQDGTKYWDPATFHSVPDHNQLPAEEPKPGPRAQRPDR